MGAESKRAKQEQRRLEKLQAERARIEEMKVYEKQYAS